MNSKAVRNLAAVALLEGFIIIWLIVTGTHFVVKTQLGFIAADTPITLAVKYDAPDKKFDEVVKQNLDSLPYRPSDQVLAILAKCAYEKRTNYVRILIENGADVEEAVKQLRKVNQEEAVKLLRQVQLELKDKP
jgi:hypothetical protein